jgi:hypothetical protein
VYILDENKYSSLETFKYRDDLLQYGSEAWVLFSLELKFDIEDIHTIAIDSITDGKNDRKCDMIYLDKENGNAIVAQSYFSDKVKRAAKKNKASDLNTAAGWILGRNLEDLPELIKPQVTDLRDALISGEINNLEFWYIHNCKENEEIASELKTVELTAKGYLKDLKKDIKISASEIGINTVEKWYKYSKSTVLVNDKFTLSTLGGYITETEEWKVYSTCLNADWFYYLFKEHDESLFSANIRNYLGSRKSDSNINNGIKNTVKDEPSNFLVFNNGITALVNEISIIEEEGNHKVELTGISIVNGAQTTGAIGNLNEAPTKALVPVRFIKCNSQKVVEKIIRFNNSQNAIQPADFRSTDAIQEELRNQFSNNFPDLNYLGARRGGSEDKIQRMKNLLVSDQVAQSLTAFHGDPINATHAKSKLWEDDNLYAKVFNENTNAGHIVFVYSLYKAVLDYKQELKNIAKGENDLKEKEKKTLEFLSHVGSIYTIMSGISISLEVILDRKIGNFFDVTFKSELSYDECLKLWNKVLRCCIPFAATSLKEVLRTKVKKKDIIENCVEQFSSLIESTREVNNDTYNYFASKVVEKK